MENIIIFAGAIILTVAILYGFLRKGINFKKIAMAIVAVVVVDVLLFQMAENHTVEFYLGDGIIAEGLRILFWISVFLIGCAAVVALIRVIWWVATEKFGNFILLILGGLVAWGIDVLVQSFVPGLRPISLIATFIVGGLAIIGAFVSDKN